jgi:hypothetical protein
MDAIAALDLAGGILAIIDLIRRAYPPETASQAVVSGDVDPQFSIDKLGELRNRIISSYENSFEPSAPAATPLLSDTMVIKDIASASIDYSGRLMENIESNISGYPRSAAPVSWRTKHAEVLSLPENRSYVEVMEHLLGNMTELVRNLIRYVSLMHYSGIPHC